MFQHRPTWLIIPQSEHVKIALHIAENWGNTIFSSIPKYKDEFLEWVRTHDRAFGINDNIEIGWEKVTYTTEERIDIIKKGFDLHNTNTIVDITVLHHLSQLCVEQQFLSSIWGKIQNYITQKIQQENLNIIYHQNLQSITWLCDNASFHFCIWKDTSLTLSVVDDFNLYTKKDIVIKIKENNIYLDPFPLKKEIEGTILWYSEKWYPDELDPYKIHYKFLSFRNRSVWHIK